MKTIKILVPTDFSDCALNAAKYALPFAKSINGEIILFHTMIYNESAFINEKDREEENTKRYNDANLRLNELANYLNLQNLKVPLSIKIECGPTLQAIEDILKTEKIDFVVMGTSGATGIKAALFGSYATDLMKHANCPIFTIPSSATYANLNDILCATEMHTSELPAIRDLMELSKKLNSRVTFLNISEDNLKHQIDFPIFQEKIRNISDYEKVDFKLEKSNNPVEVIENFACEGRYDIIVTLGKHHNFLDKLITSSVSKKLCLHNSVPMLSFPHSSS